MSNYKHIIMFKFKAHISDRNAEELLKGIGQLQMKIPEIRGFEYGRNNRDNVHNNGYQYAFVMSFNSKYDRDRYQNNSHHKRYIKHILEPAIVDAIVFDFATNIVSREVLQ